MASLISASAALDTATKVRQQNEEKNLQSRTNVMKRNLENATASINRGVEHWAGIGSTLATADVFIEGDDCSTREASLEALRQSLVVAKYSPAPDAVDFFRIEHFSHRVDLIHDASSEPSKVKVWVDTAAANSDERPTVTADPVTRCRQFHKK